MKLKAQTNGSMTTAIVAKAVSVHPNTIRMYEACGFLPVIPRGRNGYRYFSERHLDQARLIRLAYCGPYPGGAEPVVALIKHAAANRLGDALEDAYRYLVQVRSEYAQADAAVLLLERWARGVPTDVVATPLRIKEVARLLDIHPDTLRSWERNELLHTPRDPHNGYRLYGASEIGRLRVIRMLRAAGYSMMSILRLMRHLDQGRADNLRHVLDTPPPDEEILSAADSWISTLKAQEARALAIIEHLEMMLQKN